MDNPPINWWAIDGWVCFTFIGKESNTAILAVFARAGSPCYVCENNLPTKMKHTLDGCKSKDLSLLRNQESRKH
jgi:hypothetical protein